MTVSILFTDLIEVEKLERYVYQCPCGLLISFTSTAMIASKCRGGCRGCSFIVDLQMSYAEKGALLFHKTDYDGAISLYVKHLSTVDEDDDDEMDMTDYNIWEALNEMALKAPLDMDLHQACAKRYNELLPEGIREKDFWFHNSRYIDTFEVAKGGIKFGGTVAGPAVEEEGNGDEGLEDIEGSEGIEVDDDNEDPPLTLSVEDLPPDMMESLDHTAHQSPLATVSSLSPPPVSYVDEEMVRKMIEYCQDNNLDMSEGAERAIQKRLRYVRKKVREIQELRTVSQVDSLNEDQVAKLSGFDILKGEMETLQVLFDGRRHE